MTVLLVECMGEQTDRVVHALRQEGFLHDEDYGSIPISDETVIIRGSLGTSGSSPVTDLQRANLLKKRISGIVGIWPETPMEAF